MKKLERQGIGKQLGRHIYERNWERYLGRAGNKTKEGTGKEFLEETENEMGRNLCKKL